MKTHVTHEFSMTFYDCRIARGIARAEPAQCMNGAVRFSQKHYGRPGSPQTRTVQQQKIFDLEDSISRSNFTLSK